MPYGTVNADTLVTSTSGGILGAGNASIMKNRIINGAMVIDQRNAGASFAQTNGAYNLDRWYGFSFTGGATTGKYTVQQNAGSVTPPAGFKSYLGVTASTATSSSATDIYALSQPIEGYNIADLGWGTADAKTITLSFWVRSSATGTFGGALKGGQNYPFTYTISSANTWEYKTVTVTGSTSGTWQSTNSSGIEVQFQLQVGTNYTATAGTWTASGIYGATGCVNLLNNSGATFYITGVQLEVGSSATGFEYVNYQTSLANCQRYYSRLSAATSNTYTAFGSASWNASNQANCFVKYPTTMRTSPTLSYGGTVAVSYNGGGTSNVTSVGSTYAGTDSLLWQPSGLSGATDGNGGTVLANNSATAFLAFSAEL